MGAGGFCVIACDISDACIWFDCVYAAARDKAGGVYHAFEEGYTHSLFWEILLNIALFVPIGALLPLASGRKRGIWLALVTGILISTSIEGLQLWLCRGLFEFDDIFDNTLGCVLGQAVIGNPVTYLLMKISAPPKCKN